MYYYNYSLFEFVVFSNFQSLMKINLKKTFRRFKHNTSSIKNLIEIFINSTSFFLMNTYQMNYHFYVLIKLNIV